MTIYKNILKHFSLKLPLFLISDCMSCDLTPGQPFVFADYGTADGKTMLRNTPFLIGKPLISSLMLACLYCSLVASTKFKISLNVDYFTLNYPKTFNP